MALVLSNTAKVAVAQKIHDLVLVSAHWHLVLGTAGCSMVGGVGTNVLATFDASSISVFGVGSGFEGFLAFLIGGVVATPTASGMPTVAMFCSDDGSSFPPGAPVDEICRCTVGTSGADIIINDSLTAGKIARIHDNIFYQTCP